ncbi:MAG: translocation/assembly module TamB domain-containing protein [Candidatus Marinimicrobia bacterium]|nr:translocation/assembly module TamB domain-containing protein [Candidatus Neomarinimicrobiota bacterium]
MYLKNKINYIFIFVAILTIISLGLRPSFFHRVIENNVNQRWANPRGWTFSVEKMNGHFLKSFTMNNIGFSKENGNKIAFTSISFNLNIASILSGNIEFDAVKINGAEIVLNTDSGKTIVSTNSFNLRPVPIAIHELVFNGEIPIIVNEQNDKINLTLNAELGYLDDATSLKVDKLIIEESSILGFPIGLVNTTINLYSDKIELVNMMGNVGFIPLSGNATWDPSIPSFKGTLSIDSLVVPDKIFEKSPLNPEFSKLNATISLASNIKESIGSLTISNDQGLNMSGNLNIKNQKGNWRLESLSLFDGYSKLNATGGLEKNGRVYSQFTLEKLDLSQWLNNTPKTNITGLAFWDGELIEGILNNVSLSMEILETDIFPDKDISFHGTVTLQDSLFISDDPVNISIGDGSLSVSGMGDFDSKVMDITVELMDADVSLINNFWPDIFESGTATGSMKIQGPFYEPGVIADLNFLDFKYGDFTLNQLTMRAEFDNKEKVSNGALSVTFGEGVWRNEKFENGTLDISMENNIIILENCHFQNGDDFLQISGSRSSQKQYSLDRVQMSLYGHYLVNTHPLIIAIKDSSAEIQPFELHIDDGVLEGVASIGKVVDGHVKMSNFDAEIISLFIKDERWQASGIVFGEVGFQFGNGKKDIDIDISLKKGKYLNEPFEQMALSFFMKNGFLHADEISMTGLNQLGFQMNGILPLNREVDLRAPIFLNTTFTSLNMEMVTKFIPGFFDLGGQATGNIQMEGSSQKSFIHFDVHIQESRFEKIHLGATYAKGHYDGERVIFDSLSADTKFDHMVAHGSLPVDLNYGSHRLGAFFPNEMLDFHAVGDLQTMDFLSIYLSEVDSIQGNINLNLSLVGTDERIIRKGKISISDGAVYTLLVKEPIVNISGNGRIDDNMLTLDSFNGSAVKRVKGITNTSVSNISVTGQINFESFFEPKFALNIQGSDVYFETLPFDIKGLGNVDVSISGRDTINIAGTVEVLEGQIFQEFIYADIGDATPVLADEILMDYKLNFPIKGEVLFQNSQIDALVTGEISLSQFAEYDIDFGGEVFVNEGSFFYYRDEFKGLKGQVLFDNKGFNPFLDLSAYRLIDNERIDIRLGGLIDDIELSLESSSGYSESDILELLTWGKRFEDQEFTSTGFGNQAYSLLGSILEGQLEKNLKEMSGVSKLGIVDDIDISGAAGLINPGLREDFEVTAKRKLTEKTSLNVSYKRSFSLSNPNQSKVGVEYKLNRYFSVVGNMDEDGKLHLKYRYRYAY